VPFGAQGSSYDAVSTTSSSNRSVFRGRGWSSKAFSFTHPNATITIEGSADVPPMSIDVPIVHPIVVTSPVPTGDAWITITRRSGATLTWSGGATNVDFAVSLTDGTNVISCDVPSAPGTGTVPASLLAYLAPKNGLVSAFANATRTKTVGHTHVSAVSGACAMYTPARKKREESYTAIPVMFE
jgi:hypothetical protein